MNLNRSQTGTIIRAGFILFFMILHFLLADLGFGQGNPGKDGPGKNRIQSGQHLYGAVMCTSLILIWTTAMAVLRQTDFLSSLG